MSDQNVPAIAEQAQPVFNIQRTYLKGASLELPLGAAGFLEQGNPELTINIAVNSVELSAGNYEVTLRGTITTQVNGKTLSLVEIDQAGIFEIANMPAEQLPLVLEVACPRILLPYLRAHIADMLTRATLPPFHMPDVNWEAMRAERMAQGGSPAAITVH